MLERRSLLKGLLGFLTLGRFLNRKPKQEVSFTLPKGEGFKFFDKTYEIPVGSLLSLPSDFDIVLVNGCRIDIPKPIYEKKDS